METVVASAVLEVGEDYFGALEPPRGFVVVAAVRTVLSLPITYIIIGPGLLPVTSE